MRRVIGLSLPRTGNQSMHAALKALGYLNVLHDPTPVEAIALADAVTEARYAPAELAKLCPGALFVFLVRDEEPWLQSCRRVLGSGCVEPHWDPFWQRPQSDWPRLYRARLEQSLAAVPDGDLLLWNVRQGWEPLCRAIGIAVPTAPFPCVDAYSPLNTPD